MYASNALNNSCFCFISLKAEIEEVDPVELARESASTSGSRKETAIAEEKVTVTQTDDLN